LTVEQPVHAPLQSHPQRLEPDRDQPGGHQRDRQLGPLAQQRPQPAHDRHIPAHHRDREQSVHHGPVDQPVDVVQVVAQDRDPDRDVDGQDLDGPDDGAFEHGERGPAELKDEGCQHQ
jgi:hypothetical protein